MLKISMGKLIFRRTIAITAIVFALVSLTVASFFVVYIRVPVNGLSMYPTLNFNIDNGKDHVYINRFGKTDHQDIVVLDLTQDNNFGNFVVKRLIAIEGDIVNIIMNNETMQFELIVNSQVVDSRPFKINEVNIYNTYNNFKSYLNSVPGDQKNEQGLIVGENQIFVLGDNWESSKDSAMYGPFNINTLVGKVDIITKPHKNELWQIFKQIFK